MSSQLPLQISHAQGFLRKMEKNNKELEWAKAQKIEIGVDLVAAAKRQLQLLSTVDSNRFLHEGPTLDRTIYRYNAYWLPLLAKHSESPLFEGPLVVPLDCEWIWHCHRLNPVQYISDCEELYGKILDNCNVISTTTIHERSCLKESEKVWNELYPQEPFSFNFNSQEDDVPKMLSQIEKYTKYDLVSAVKRQTPFFFQVSQPHMKNEDFLEEAVARYRGFLYLIKSNMDEYVERFCVPTYDIDLIWHTHQLHPHSYCKDMKTLLGLVLDHDDMDSDRSVGKKLDIGFTRTTKQWDDTFGTRYWKLGAMYRGPAPRIEGVVKSGGCNARIRSKDMVKSGGCSAGTEGEDLVKSDGCTATTGCGSKVKSGGCTAAAGCGSTVKSGGCTGCGSMVKSSACTGCGSMVKSGGCTVAAACGSLVKSGGCTVAAGWGSIVKSGGCTAAAGCGSKVKNDGCTATCRSTVKSNGCTAAAGCRSTIMNDGCTTGAGCGSTIKSSEYTTGAGCKDNVKSGGCNACVGCGIMV